MKIKINQGPGVITMKSKISYSILLGAILVLTGCVRTPSYNPKSLKSIALKSDYTGIEKNIILRIKKLSETEISHLFGKRGEQFENHRSPLIPLHISIHNLSNTSLILYPKNVTLDSLSYRTVSKHLQTSSVGKTIRTIGYGALTAILTTGASIVGVLYGYASCNDSYVNNSKSFINITAPLIIIATPIIAFVKTISSARTNNKIKRDIREKVLRKNITIYPGQQYDTLLFVRAVDYHAQFTLTLTEENKNKTDKSITFNVAMKKNNFVQSNQNKR